MTTRGATTRGATTRGATTRWLLVWALAYNAAHHLGLLPRGLGDAGGATRWADWLDLAVPYLVLVPALLALAAAGSDRRGWGIALVSAAAYLQGHGIHLAANSISNARGNGAPVHLWDEVVGHALWYGGLAVLVAALARAAAHSDLRVTPAAVALAVLTGATWTTNALGAPPLVPGALVAALLLAGYGWGLRGTAAGVLLRAAYLPSAAALSAALLL